MPALTSFWIKSLRSSGYGVRRWKELNNLFRLALEQRVLDENSREVLKEISSRLPALIRTGGQTNGSLPRASEPVRAPLSREGIAVYTARLLNEWMPVEVARMLLDENEPGTLEERGIPVLVMGNAIERLLVREHLSLETMEMLADQEPLSPEHLYPADLELFRDVVLSLLGRTTVPTSPLLPATLLFVSPASHLAPDYREALRHAQVVKRPNSEEIHVPIAPDGAFAILNEEQLRIGSIIVTMDGRWWQSENLQLGEQHFIVYRPGSLLRMEHSGGFAQLCVPWPENRLRWEEHRSPVAGIRIFGREWCASKWEVNAERTWLHLRMSRALSIAEIVPGSAGGPWRLPPASVDMGWAALASALLESLRRRDSYPIEELRDSDLIPLGRAVARLIEAVMSRQRRGEGRLEVYLASIRYAEGNVSSYGRVPWKILPEPVRQALLRMARDPLLFGLVNDAFDGCPKALRPPAPRSLPPRSAS